MAGMQQEGGGSVADRPRESVTSPSPDVHHHHTIIGTAMTSVNSGEVVDVKMASGGRIRIPCNAAAPLVLNGGMYAGCQLDRDHDKQDPPVPDHEFVLRWR
jgi:hypothetical protein